MLLLVSGIFSVPGLLSLFSLLLDLPLVLCGGKRKLGVESSEFCLVTCPELSWLSMVAEVLAMLVFGVIAPMTVDVTSGVCGGSRQRPEDYRVKGCCLGGQWVPVLDLRSIV